MATADGITKAIGCLSLDFPQFAAKELSHLVDGLLAAVQTITDPLAELGTLNIQDIVDGVAELSQGDIVENTTEAIAGLAVAAVERDSQLYLSAMETGFPNATKASQALLNQAEKVATAGMLTISLISDSPYIAAQKICETIDRLVTLKIANLQCLKKHVRQLHNAVLLMLKNAETFADTTLADLAAVSAQLTIVEAELLRSNKTVGGAIVFDSSAFGRAYNAMLAVNSLLAPTNNTPVTILSVTEVLTFGSMDDALLTSANLKLSTMIIPALVQMIRVEVAAYVDQTTVINYHLEFLAGVIQNFNSVPVQGRVKEIRARLIVEIQSRVDELHQQVDRAIARQSISMASAEAVLWSSRAKTIITFMNRVRKTSLQEGSINGPDAAAALSTAYLALLGSIQAINSDNTVAGVEDTTELATKARAVASAADRLVGLFDVKPPNANKIASFETLSSQTAIRSGNLVDLSIKDATALQTACRTYMAIPIGARLRYDKLANAMGDLGLDRAKDLLGSGDFANFLNSSIDTLSYLGSIIVCLGDVIGEVDDQQTKDRVNEIRNQLIGQRTNESLALVDKAKNRVRFIEKIQDRIQSIQKNAKVVETILARLKEVGLKLEANVQAATVGISEFSSNVDHLEVGAGGRLADGLEEFSKHPRGGVPLC